MCLRTPRSWRMWLPWIDESRGTWRWGLQWFPERGNGGCMFGFCGLKTGPWATTCPWFWHHWQRPKNGRGVEHPTRLVDWKLLINPSEGFQEDRGRWFLLLLPFNLEFVRLAVAGRDKELFFWRRASSLFISFSYSLLNEIGVSQPLIASMTVW